MAKKIKLAYLIVRKSFSGLLKQIEYDRQLMQDLKDIDYKNFTFLDQLEKDSKLYRLPFIFRGLFGRKLFAWLWLLNNARKFDYVIIRHMEFDPFALIFAWFIPNRIVVHHSREVEELLLIEKNWKGKVASIMEKISGRISAKTSTALLTVSLDLINYQRKERHLPENFPIIHFPNGIIVNNTPILENLVPKKGIIELGFIAEKFSPWHGLDLLIDNCEKEIVKNTKQKIIIHLIGSLNSDYLKQIKLINNKKGNIEIKNYGNIRQKEYIKVFKKCTIGIGSLAMHRVGLTDGSTLKVREMLAMGLPVFSGHKDTAIPNNFPYYYYSMEIDINKIIDFAHKMSKTTRKEVRNASYQYIDKKRWILKLVKEIKILHKRKN